MHTTWIGHACLMVETQQGTLLTDPWLVDPCLYNVVVHQCRPALSVDTLPSVDVLCITHAHYDHFDPRTLQHLSKTALVIIPPSPLRRLEQKLRALGFTRIHTLPYWQTVDACGMSITAVPSQNIPEECGFVIRSGNSTIFHAADSVYWPYARQLVQFDIDVAFVPYTGWEVSGTVGVDVARQWQPDWEETVRNATSIGARCLVPSSCDQFWSPPSLRWLNDRVHPGRPDEFIAAVDAYRAKTPGIKAEAVAMTPGSSWSKTGGFQIRPEDGSEPVAIPDPEPPRTKVPLAELMTRARQFVSKRRPQLLACLKDNPIGVWVLLSSRHTFYLHDTDCYFRLHLLDPRGVYALNEDTPGTPRISITSQDAYDLFAGTIDAEMIVMGARANVTRNKTEWDLIRIYAMEYLFVKETYSG